MVATDERRWAVLVGATTYECFNQLSYSAADARDFAKALEQQLGFEPARTMLLGDVKQGADFEPMRSKILHAMASLSNQDSGYYADHDVEPMGEDDVFVFYFSGHGLRTNSGDQYLLPVDASDQSPWETAVSLEELTKQISNLPCRHKVLFIDACRSEFDEGAKDAVTTPGIGYEAPSREGLATFYSCDPEKRSYEIGKEIKHGSFTHCLLEAVRDAEVNTLRELNGYLQRHVPSLNVRHGKAPQQPYFVPNPLEMEGLPLFTARIDLRLVRRYMSQANNWLAEERIGYPVWDAVTGFLDDVRRGEGYEINIRLSILKYFFRGEIQPEEFLSRWQRVEPRDTGDGPKVDLSPPEE